jgi:uncharacterized protein (TIRG00374 family)
VSQQAPGRTRKIVLTLIGLGVSALFAWLTLRRVSMAELGRHMLAASVPILLLSLITKLIGMTFMTLRSTVVLGGVGRFRFLQLFRSIFIVTGGNAILPLRLGEILRIGFLVRTGEASASACLGAVALERLLDMVCLVVLFAVIMPLTMLDLPAGASLYALAAVLALGLGGSMWAARNPEQVEALAGRIAGLAGPAVADRIRGLVRRLAQGLSSLRSGRGVALVVLYTLGYWLASAGSVLVWLWAFDLHLPWYAPFLVMFFSALGSFLPSSPSAVGTYHFFTTQALLLLGVELALATSVVVVGHALAFFPVALVSLPWLVIEVLALIDHRRAEPRSEQPASAGTV